MIDQDSPNLRGLRVGLSGAIPEPSEWAGRALDWEVLNAVSTLADLVFGGNGHLVHGSHPSFTPRILGQAVPYARARGVPVATFLLSGLFGDGLLARQLSDPSYEGVIERIVVDAVVPPGHEPSAADPQVRNPSLAALRQRLIGEMDALVLIGGKCWRGHPNKPGLLEELDLAIDRGIPCFLLGGLGGMAAELASDPNYRVRLGNGLDAADNEFVLASADYGRAIYMIAERLASLRPLGNPGSGLGQG